jgi:RHS repeat-associated protein
MVLYKDSQGEEWKYLYDGFGRRYEKSRTHDPISQYYWDEDDDKEYERDPYRTTSYDYLGLSHTIIQENQDVERWNNKTTQTQSLYLIGPGGRSYASIETYTKNGRTYNSNHWRNRRYYHYDRLGSLSSVSYDKPGYRGADYDYTPFGQSIEGYTRRIWGEGSEKTLGYEEIGFTGQRTDYESGNIHFPFREYDPLSASFTTEDPIKDGMLWYGYVGNNPVNFVDPLGLDFAREAGSGPAAAGGATGARLPNVGGPYITPSKVPPNVSQAPAGNGIAETAVPGVGRSIPLGLTGGPIGVVGFGLNVDGSGVLEIPDHVQEYILGSILFNMFTYPDATPLSVETTLSAYNKRLADIKKYEDARIQAYIEENEDKLTEEDEVKVYYINYRKPHSILASVWYVGIVSGAGTSPQEVLDRYDNTHRMNFAFDPAILVKAATGPLGFFAMRGYEQQMIDQLGGAWSDVQRDARGERPLHPSIPRFRTNRNRRRGVGVSNILGPLYWAVANEAYGNLMPFTGKQTWEIDFNDPTEPWIDDSWYSIFCNY